MGGRVFRSTVYGSVGGGRPAVYIDEGDVTEAIGEVWVKTDTGSLVRLTELWRHSKAAALLDAAAAIDALIGPMRDEADRLRREAAEAADATADSVA